MLKCIKILEPKLKDSIICGKDAEYLYQGASFCYEHGEEILQEMGTGAAQFLLQQKLTIPQPVQQQAVQNKPKLFLK